MTYPYPRDLIRDDRDGQDDAFRCDCTPDDCVCCAEIAPALVQPARHQRPAIGRDHDCVIRPDAQPVAVSVSLEDRVARLERDMDGLRRLERDLDGLRRKVISMEPMPG